LLKAAGHDGLEVTLHTSGAVAGMDEMATALKEQASSAGITINVKRTSASAYFDSEQSYLCTCAPFYQSNWASFSFEDHAVDALLENSPYNETAWKRPQWSAEFRKAQAIPDADTRNARYQDLQVPLWEEGGMLIPGFGAQVDAIAPAVEGMQSSPVFPLGNFVFDGVWLAS
jgi:peptide/nickel transport system substrate-binding protein